MQHRGGTRTVVGREPELEIIGRAVEAARTGSPAVVLVSGDAGIGKSTLVAEAAARRQARRAVVSGPQQERQVLRENDAMARSGCGTARRGTRWSADVRPILDGMISAGDR